MQSHISLETGEITINNETESTQSLPVDDSLIIDIEDTNIDFYLEEEFDKEPLQFGVELEDIDIEDGLTIENFFNIQMYEQNQKETIERSSIDYSQPPTSTTEDWSIYY
ncbi:25768_t:CDS:2 [Dentiscutata erythropus]|uniref:25768_t:CDS:1 n=1 Tax=Dentiscutata erythropus TaxID=1348616 RepID=A0A9N9DEW6_9GLOM|nr:25768_t:CDS:2 [Dentiscutata erythropus]